MARSNMPGSLTQARLIGSGSTKPIACVIDSIGSQPSCNRYVPLRQEDARRHKLAFRPFHAETTDRTDGAPPEPVSVRTALFPEGIVLPRQRAPWGKLLFAVHRVAEFWIDGELALSPPAYAISIPPEQNTGHARRARPATPLSISS